MDTTEEIVELELEAPAPSADLLRHAREARELDLSEVAARTRINPWILKRLEAGDFQALPAGVYARAYLRAYATTVGLDPEATLKLFEPLLPRPDQRPGDLVRARQHKAGQVPRRELPVTTPSAVTPTSSAGALASGVPPSRWRRFGAMATDATLLVALTGGILSLSALVCGVAVTAMFEASAIAVSVLFVMIAFWYFILLGGVGGHTAGTYLLGVSLLEPPSGPLDLLATARRGAECLLKESSMLLDLLVSGGPRESPIVESPDRPTVRS